MKISAIFHSMHSDLHIDHHKILRRSGLFAYSLTNPAGLVLRFTKLDVTTMRLFPMMKSYPLVSPSKYMDMESSPSLLPSDESSGGSISESFLEDQPPSLGSLRNMRRGGPFHMEEPPRLAPRKAIFRGGTHGPPQENPPQKNPPLPGSHDASIDEMRKVLRAVGAIDGSEQKRGKGKGWSTRRQKEGKLFTKEPVWKRRLRNLKSSLVPDYAAEKAVDQQQKFQRSRNGFIKSVSFDDQSLTHPSAADDFSPTRKKKAPASEENMPSPLQRAGSSFSDFFRKVTDEDLFSLDTPSFWSDQTSIATEDDDTTIASYPQMRIPKMECRKPASCGIMNLEQMRNYKCSSDEPASCGVMDQEQVMSYGCSSGESVIDDLRLVADLLISDATCRTFMTDEAIPRRGNTENS